MFTKLSSSSHLVVLCIQPGSGTVRAVYHPVFASLASGGSRILLIDGPESIETRIEAANGALEHAFFDRGATIRPTVSHKSSAAAHRPSIRAVHAAGVPPVTREGGRSRRYSRPAFDPMHLCWHQLVASESWDNRCTVSAIRAQQWTTWTVGKVLAPSR